MLKIILISLATALAIFLIVAARQPSTFRVERSTTISASPAEVFPHLNDLRKTQVWSPWVKLDPSAKYTFEGPEAGVGATSSWAGNSKVGEGRQTIVESRPNERVGIKLDFKKPFESTSLAEFTVRPEGERSGVTWSLSGENNFVCKVFCTILSQDKMIGEPFEQGLAELKALVEGAKK